MLHNKENWHNSITCERVHEQFHSHEEYYHCSDVSHVSSNVAKTETKEQESDSYQYEPDQEGDGDELFAVKGKGKGGFKGTCFKCGMRGHKVDKCWQKGKGKGG